MIKKISILSILMIAVLILTSITACTSTQNTQEDINIPDETKARPTANLDVSAEATPAEEPLEADETIELTDEEAAKRAEEHEISTVAANFAAELNNNIDYRNLDAKDWDAVAQYVVPYGAELVQSLQETIEPWAKEEQVIMEVTRVEIIDIEKISDGLADVNIEVYANRNGKQVVREMLLNIGLTDNGWLVYGYGTHGDREVDS